MTRLIRRLRPSVERFISYQDTEAHTGAIYRAAGWVPTVRSQFDTWNKPNSRNLSGRPRTRPADQSTADKQRWEKVIQGDGTPVRVRRVTAWGVGEVITNVEVGR